MNYLFIYFLIDIRKTGKEAVKSYWIILIKDMLTDLKLESQFCDIKPA